MPHYRYRALTKAGEIILGDVDAPSREEVLRAHRISRPPAGRGGDRGQPRGGGGSISGLPRPRETTTFLRLLALLLRSGLTLEAALQTLEDDTNKAVARTSPGGQRSAVSGGDGFAEALERHDSHHRADLHRHGAGRRSVRQARGGAAGDRRGPHPARAVAAADQFCDPLSAVFGSGRR